MFFFQVKSLCDVEYRKLNFSAYPVHVHRLKNYAFKPIVIAVMTYEADPAFEYHYWQALNSDN